MHKKFDHVSIEKKWHDEWEKSRIYDVGERDITKEKEYVLVEWPYPSGNLHVGHWFAFAVTDIYARARRMEGKQVLFPMGFDAFGLPAENAAIKRGLDPKGWTESNIAYMKEQLRSMGNSFSWDKTTSSTDPEYYRWTQWMFTEFLKHNIAYRGKGKVNWCPGCNTVLANEQVLPNGTCERSGDTVEQREMTQWMLRITDFADALIDDLKDLDWPEFIKESQRNWIGRSQGARITFSLNIPSSISEVVFASNNIGKIARMQKLLADAGLAISLKTPEDIGVTDFDVTEDGETLRENAIKKARALREYTSLPVLADDTGFFIENSLVSPVTVKRNALQGKDEKTLSVDEISELMLAYYRNIATQHGGTIDAEWRHSIVLIDANGDEHDAEATRGVTLTNETHGVVDPHLPVRGLYIAKATGKYALEQSEEEELTELRPITVALQKLLGTTVDVFTTRPDTLFGATYLVLAPEHPLVEKLKVHISNVAEVEAYQMQTRTKKDEERTAEGKEKTGVHLEGITATNPASKEEIPVFISDYVISTYGTGALMAVPAHDERDFAFAKKFVLPIKEVIERNIEATGLDAVREGLNLVTIEAVDLIIEHPSDGTFLLQTEQDGTRRHIHFVGGGTDGEDDETAIARELREETGFVNFSILGGPVATHSVQGYRHTKNINQRSHGGFYHVKLKDLEQVPSEIEEGKHIIEWVTKDEVASRITWEGHVFGWKYFLGESFHAESGTLTQSGQFDGTSSEETKTKITAYVGGKMENTYRLRDWSIGRQRYWGVPIPVVYDPEGNAHPIPKEHLPWHLPTDVDHTPTGEPPLSKSQELKDRVTKIFGEGWTPDYETMDTFVDSSWYFLRYIDNKNDAEFSSKKAQEDWMPIDIYFGGAEHTTMHLLYSRFWQKALHTLGLVTTSEPYVKRINRGLVLGTDGNKMSKSKGNVIDPDEQVKNLGADTVKMYLAFMGPYGEVNNYPWDMGGIVGIRRFLERVYGLSTHITEEESEETTRLLHKTTKKVGEDISLYKFNTAISALMVFVNHVEKTGLTQESYTSFIKLLAPFAPHLTEELWAENGHTTSIHTEAWPVYNERLIKDELVTIGVQINGRMRGTITISPEASDDEVLEIARSDVDLKGRLVTPIKKVIYVKGKIINLILEE